MVQRPESTVDQILAAAPLLAPDIPPARVAEIVPQIQAVLESVARLDDLGLDDYEPCLTLRLEPEKG